MEIAKQTRRIAIIGAPGSGKSTLARGLEKQCGWTVFDTDDEFTRRYGDISTYFGHYGEQAFRKLENELLIEAANSGATVIATGGGAVLNREGMYALRKACDIVRLDCPIDVLVERTIGSERPLAGELERITAEREPLYRKYADYTVSGGAGMIESLIRVLNTPRANRYDIVLSDADGTLLDFRSSMKIAIVQSCRALGDIHDSDMIVDIYSGIINDLWNRLERGEVTHPQLDAMRFEMLSARLGGAMDPVTLAEVFFQKLTTNVITYDGATELLRALGARGIKTYIVTNSFARYAKRRLRVFDGMVDGEFVSEAVGYDKPDVKYFEKVFSALGNPDKSRILMFGDSETADIDGGINAGIDTCLYDVSLAKKTRADYSVGSYAELINLI